MVNHTEITPDGLVSLLLAAGDIRFLSAQIWPLDVALIAVTRQVESESAVARAVSRMPKGHAPHGNRHDGLREAIHRLVATGALVPSGHGLSAGYEVSAAVLNRASALLNTLPASDVRALASGGHALSDATSMASKNRAASAPAGSATI